MSLCSEQSITSVVRSPIHGLHITGPREASTNFVMYPVPTKRSPWPATPCSASDSASSPVAIAASPPPLAPSPHHLLHALSSPLAEAQGPHSARRGRRRLVALQPHRRLLLAPPLHLALDALSLRDPAPCGAPRTGATVPASSPLCHLIFPLDPPSSPPGHACVSTSLC